MKTATKVSVAFMFAGLLWMLAAFWFWALFGMREEIGQAHGITAVTLFVGGLCGVGITKG